MILLSLELVGLQNRYASKDNAMKKVQAGDHVIIEYEGMLEDDVIVACGTGLRVVGEFSGNPDCRLGHACFNSLDGGAPVPLV